MARKKTTKKPTTTTTTQETTTQETTPQVKLTMSDLKPYLNAGSDAGIVGFAKGCNCTPQEAWVRMRAMTTATTPEAVQAAVDALLAKKKGLQAHQDATNMLKAWGEQSLELPGQELLAGLSTEALSCLRVGLDDEGTVVLTTTETSGARGPRGKFIYSVDGNAVGQPAQVHKLLEKEGGESAAWLKLWEQWKGYIKEGRVGNCSPQAGWKGTASKDGSLTLPPAPFEKRVTWERVTEKASD